MVGFGVLVGVFVIVGVLVRVLVAVAVDVKVGITNPVLVAISVAEGTKVEFPSWPFGKGVQVAGRARGLAVAVGSARVGMSVGGGKGFSAIFGLAKTLA